MIFSLQQEADFALKLDWQLRKVKQTLRFLRNYNILSAFTIANTVSNSNL